MEEPSADLTVEEFVRWVDGNFTNPLGVWWLTENPAFGGRTPMQVVEAGERQQLVAMVFHIHAGDAA